MCRHLGMSGRLPSIPSIHSFQGLPRNHHHARQQGEDQATEYHGALCTSPLQSTYHFSPMAIPNGIRLSSMMGSTSHLEPGATEGHTTIQQSASHLCHSPQPTSFAIWRVARCKIREQNIDSCDLLTHRCQIQSSARCPYSLKFHFYFLIRQHCGGREERGWQYSRFLGAREACWCEYTSALLSLGNRGFQRTFTITV